MMNKYILLEETNGERFAEKVNALLAEGWRLAGSLVYHVQYDATADAWAYFYAREFVRSIVRTPSELVEFQRAGDLIAQ